MYAADIAQRCPERVAVVMTRTGEQWSFADYEAQANRVAHLLREAGLREGDCIALVMMNSPEMLAIQAAAERTGLYHTAINWHLKPAEAAWIVNDSAARNVFTEARVLDSVRDLPALCPGVERWVMVDAPADAGPFVDYRGVVEARAISHVPDERTGRPLPYSSGTTGKPKGILRALPGTDPSEPVPIQKVAEVVYQFRDGMVFLEPAPMYHSAVHSHLSSALRVGGTSIVMDRFDAEGFLSLVAEYRVTHVAMVPTMFSRLLQLPEDVRARYDISSLEAVVHGAAPCPPAVKRQMIEWVGPILFENFGATEGNGSTVASSQEWLERPGTVGRPIFGTPVILDAEGSEVPAGTIGQIWWRGPVDFEYLNDKTKTAETIADGRGVISSVGDIGYVDEDGYLFPTDRASFTIIRGGVNVYPQEVENVLVDHPAVADVAVFGIPHPDLGESVQALVELRPGYSPGHELEEELIGFCREQLARFKCPAAVDFTDELPRLESGKVQKKLLRAQYVERSAAEAERAR
jgi:long-chain acyl-CoA synthetase